MSIPQRPRQDVRREQWIFVLAMACAAYPIWFCADDLVGKTLDWSQEHTIIPAIIIGGGLAAFVYFIGSWRLLKYAEYEPKQLQLDQLETQDWEVVRVPIQMKVLGLFALLLHLGLTLYIGHFAAKQLLVRQVGLSSFMGIKVLLIIPTAALTAMLIFKSLFKKRMRHSGRANT